MPGTALAGVVLAEARFSVYRGDGYTRNTGLLVVLYRPLLFGATYQLI